MPQVQSDHHQTIDGMRDKMSKNKIYCVENPASSPMSSSEALDDALPRKRNSIISYESSDDEDEDMESEGHDRHWEASPEEAELDGKQQRVRCHDLARSAMSLTQPDSPAPSIARGRLLLAQSTSLRTVPGLRAAVSPLGAEDVTVEDCLTAYYLSEANKNLGRANSQHYFLQEALTLVESVVLRAQRRPAGPGTRPNAYDAATVDPRSVLDAWTRAATLGGPVVPDPLELAAGGVGQFAGR